MSSTKPSAPAVAALRLEASAAVNEKYASLGPLLRISKNDSIRTCLTRLSDRLREDQQVVLVSTSAEGFSRIFSVVELFKVKVAEKAFPSIEAFSQHNKLDHVLVSCDYDKVLRGKNEVDPLLTITRSYKLPVFLVQLRLGDPQEIDTELVSQGWVHQPKVLTD